MAATEIITPRGMAWWRVRPIFLFIALAAVLRLANLTQPSIWGDEALTYGRVIGSYRDLLDSLQHDGFAPLHYELYWVLARFFQLTPTVLRAVPAIAGILMVPAIYFLARQFAGKWTANLAALFTAGSAYMLVYSRDAKMYCHFWLFCILTAACYLWWLRTGRRIAWLAWIACGVAMVGLHTPGVVILGLLPLFLITFDQVHWKQGLLTLIGIAVVLAGPAGYYYKFSPMIEQVDQQDFQAAAGTFWVERYNQGRTGPEHVLYATTAFLTGWEWPRQSDQKNVDPDRLWWLETAAIALLAALAAGTLPWPRQASQEKMDFARGGWRRCLWLSAWLVVPTYAFYRASVSHGASPGDWIGAVGDLFGPRWLAADLCAAVVAGVASRLIRSETGPQNPRHFREMSVGAALLVAIVLALNFWVLPGNLDAGDRVCANALVIGSGILFCASQKTFKRRIVDLLLLAAVAAAVLLLCQIVYWSTPDEVVGSIWQPRYVALAWPAFAIIVAALISRLPTRGLRWAVIGALLIVNLQQFLCRVAANVNVDPAQGLIVTGSEPPVDLIARDIIDSDALRSERIGAQTVRWRPRSATRVYCPAVYRPSDGSPGTGTIASTAGRYELTMQGGNPLTPAEFRALPNNSNGFIYDFPRNVDPRFIANDVARNPQLRKIIVWDNVNGNASTRPDPLFRLLGRDWDLLSQEQFIVQDHWRWVEMGTFRRREYRRRDPLPAPATRVRDTNGGRRQSE